MNEQQKHMKRLLEDGNVEIRCIDKVSDLALRKKNPVIWSGVFDDYNALRHRVMWAEKQGFDIYSTINPVSLPVTNGDLKPYKQTAKDKDITKITTLFFDFDAVRETGTAATQRQVDLALNQSHKLVDWLEDEHDFSFPTIGLSGNGAHLLYRTDMSIEQAECFSGLYAGLKKRFSTDDVEFDVVVRNPARIARVLGTMNRKAGKRSECVFYGEATDAELIIALAEKISPPKPKTTWVTPGNEQKGGKFIKNWDIAGAFSRAGLYLQQTKDPGKHWVTCPWIGEHGETGKTDTVIYEGEWAQFSCSHSHCANRDISDVAALLGNN